MAKDKIEGLISDLHDKLADSDTSAEQDRMISLMQSQLDEWEGAKPADGDLRETAEMLLADLEEKHPRAAAILKEIMETLHHAGL